MITYSKNSTINLNINNDKTILYGIVNELNIEELNTISKDKTSSTTSLLFTNKHTKTNIEKKQHEIVVKEYYEECANKYKELFFITTQNEFIDEGYISDSQRLYSKIIDEFGTLVGEKLLSKLYLQYSNNKKFVISVLYLIGELDYKEIEGFILGITAFALRHEDCEIQDLALQCFEKWDNKEYVETLKGLKFEVKYLEEYKQSIIDDIEGE